MTDKEELRNLADRCKMWASHPVPFAGSFGDVVAEGATVKDWGAVPELATPSHTATPDDRVDDGLRGPLDLAPSAIEPRKP